MILSDIERVQRLCIIQMNKNEANGCLSVVVPVNIIDRVKWVDGGWDIHCENGWNYRLHDGLYEEGRDSGPNARPLPRAGMLI
jgi:hypothetical protein